jgi:predicted acyltransferase
MNKTKSKVAALPSPARLLSLDALRGMSVTMMIFACYLPLGLPGWMYQQFS